MTDDYLPLLRQASAGALQRERDGRAGELQTRLLMLGWLEFDPALPGRLSLTVTGEGEMVRLTNIAALARRHDFITSVGAKTK